MKIPLVIDGDFYSKLAVRDIQQVKMDYHGARVKLSDEDNYHCIEYKRTFYPDCCGMCILSQFNFPYDLHYLNTPARKKAWIKKYGAMLRHSMYFLADRHYRNVFQAILPALYVNYLGDSEVDSNAAAEGYQFSQRGGYEIMSQVLEEAGFKQMGDGRINNNTMNKLIIYQAGVWINSRSEDN